MLEADKRFLKTAPGQWPVVRVRDHRQRRGTQEPNVDEYNKFMNDFLARGGAAHAVIMQGKRTGWSPILSPISSTTPAAFATTMITDTQPAGAPAGNRQPSRRRSPAHDEPLRSGVSAGDPKAMEPVVNVTVSRDDVQLQMSYAAAPFAPYRRWRNNHDADRRRRTVARRRIDHHGGRAARHPEGRRRLTSWPRLSARCRPRQESSLPRSAD